ncbi:MAG TPA: hypothetical protein VGQ21_14490 [Thermoanaerobaculia bacterium]|jgi:hypothetical protein|nr:hypothetical protein [Thermoanaerobaculia bacterium]
MWIWFLFISYAISVLTLSHIQIRGKGRAGSWRSFNKQPFIETYWRQLSAVERILLWTGMAAFVITFVISAGAHRWGQVNG